MTRRSRPLLVAAVLAVGAAACGGDDDPVLGGGDERPGVPGASADTAGAASEATVVGENTAFDVTALDATVGEPLTITFDNRDDGIQHNLQVEGTASGDAMTEIAEGPVTQTLEVTFDDSGEFDYLCEVHPQEMRGTVTVSP